MQCVSERFTPGLKRMVQNRILLKLVLRGEIVDAIILTLMNRPNQTESSGLKFGRFSFFLKDELIDIKIIFYEKNRKYW